MTLQEKYAATAIGATVTASAPTGDDGLDDFETQLVWLTNLETSGHVTIIDIRYESYTGHRRSHRVTFRRLAWADYFLMARPFR